MDVATFKTVLEGILELEETLTCSYCNEIFKDPVIIGRCGHTFCQKCVEKQTGKHCFTCKIPVLSKDSHEDKQLRELLSSVQELKLLLSEPEDPENEDVLLVKAKSVGEIFETPLRNKTFVNNEKPSVKSASRPCRVKKPPKCQDPECHSSPKVCLVPIDLKNVTPVNMPIKKRMAMTSPIIRKVRSPSFRFIPFSAGKRFQNRLKNARPPVILPLSANIEKKNGKGETLLHVAVIKGDIDRVKMLLMKKANPNVKDNAGWTPLHEASNHGYLEIADLLVKHGANVNVTGPDSITPLHDAIMNGKIEIAKFLASKGADIYTRTSQDKNALDLCLDNSLVMDLRNAFSESKKSKEIAKKIKSPESSKKTENMKIVLLSTCLSEDQRQILQNCASNVLQADVVSDFTPAVTHVITSLDKGQCPRTLKIFRGILYGKWIVNFTWIKACLKQKKKVSEEEYEALGTKQQPNTQGPQRARLNAMEQLPPLFQGCHFYMYGQFNPPLPSKDEISQLIQIGGGKLLAREPKPETVEQGKFQAPYHATEGPLADFSHFILHQDKPPRQTPIRSNHICTVHIDWFINSICAFVFLDPDSV